MSHEPNACDSICVAGSSIDGNMEGTNTKQLNDIPNSNIADMTVIDVGRFVFSIVLFIKVLLV
jgi:hypothetical protein